MAAAGSSSVALGQVATTSPLAGLRLSNVSSLLDATNSPLMSSWYALPVMAWVAVSVAMEPPSKTWGDGTGSAIAHYSRCEGGVPERGWLLWQPGRRPDGRSAPAGGSRRRSPDRDRGRSGCWRGHHRARRTGPAPAPGWRRAPPPRRSGLGDPPPARRWC